MANFNEWLQGNFVKIFFVDLVCTPTFATKYIYKCTIYVPFQFF